jgi:hypothetical protein
MQVLDRVEYKCSHCELTDTDWCLWRQVGRKSRRRRRKRLWYLQLLLWVVGSGGGGGSDYYGARWEGIYSAEEEGVWMKD